MCVSNVLQAIFLITEIIGSKKDLQYNFSDHEQKKTWEGHPKTVEKMKKLLRETKTYFGLSNKHLWGKYFEMSFSFNSAWLPTYFNGVFNDIFEISLFSVSFYFVVGSSEVSLKVLFLFGHYRSCQHKSLRNAETS